MTEDIISIIVPIYKVEEYLERCIESLITQTYPYFELILVDDGSPDKCGEICDRYSKIDSRIKVIHKENGGLSDARNKGLDFATGKYITFIDSDDWVDSDYLKVLYKLLIDRNADISICNFIKTESDSFSIIKENDEVLEFSNIEALERIYSDLSVQLTISWGKLYKAELFRKIRFPYRKIHEDEFTTYKLLYKANKIVYTNRMLIYYWQRADSIMGQGFKLKNKLDSIEALKERILFFENIDKKILSFKTYRRLFGLYVNINDNINFFDDIEAREDYLADFNKFKNNLRSSKQTLLFKIYYECYFISPRLTNFIKKKLREVFK